ncbi:MAG: glutamine--fructose-6-phosphate transaminase (isomerizing) [Calditrichaeota bacterium]|nr:glutamine--fructose-6-phosphate transaminase (isomerizing) [Calditrichota bacterium]
MCGIIGYVGHRSATPILVNGLKRMEYRGYDSAGIAVVNNGSMQITKVGGKISGLVERINGSMSEGSIGIGHTRWATHGEPNEINAHPHTDCTGRIVLIHNGIIENYYTLKTGLAAKGHIFKTDTDSEVLAHLIEELDEGDIEQAVRRALSQVKGTYGIVVLSHDEPDRLIAARLGSPLVLGIGTGENFIASDLAAVVDHTRNVIFLDDGEFSVVTKDGIANTTLAHEPLDKRVDKIFFDIQEIEKGGYPHFMLKEIAEQPNSLTDSLRGRVIEAEGNAKLGGLVNFESQLAATKRIIILGCGTSWHAGLIGEYLIEELAGIPVEVEYASEFRYRNPIVERGTIALAISQSGETIDTLAAMREARARGALALGVCNVVGSTIARESDGGVYIHAGPEIGVASTKAFTSQVAVLTLLALKLGRNRKLSLERGREIVHGLIELPQKVRQVLASSDQILELARKFADSTNALYLSRGINYPVALEGALKLKEISYIHAEGYPAAEMKHGPIALIDENMPVIFIATNGAIYDKVLSNIEEVRARKGVIIAVVNEGDDVIRRHAHHMIEIPRTDSILSPILAVIPLQLLAYHMAVLRGCNIDQPRNLAKSVTVE